MIIETKTYRCSKCESENIIKNGSNRYKNQQYLCKDCGASRVLTPTKLGPTDEEKQAILKTYAERSSLRGLTRIFKFSRTTITKVIKENEMDEKKKALLNLLIQAKKTSETEENNMEIVINTNPMNNIYISLFPLFFLYKKNMYICVCIVHYKID